MRRLLLLISLILVWEAASAQSSIEIGDGKPYRLQTVVRQIAVGGIAISDAGDAYVTDTLRGRIHRIDRTGNATIFAGAGTPEIYLHIHVRDAPIRHFSGDAGPALAAHFDSPHGIVTDSKGNIYVADSGNSRIRKISTDGFVQTVAGTGKSGYSGDGGPANRAKFALPMGLAMDPEGSLFVADYGNNRVRKIDANGTVTTIAGNGKRGDSGDGVLAIKTKLFAPLAVFIDKAFNLYITDLYSDKVRRVDSARLIHAVAEGEKTDLLRTMSRMLYPARTDDIEDGAVTVAQDSALGVLRISGTNTVGSAGTQHVFIAPDGRIYFSDSSGLRVLTPIQ
jgi:DNA-binding beta-propeller fold protein YncE